VRHQREHPDATYDDQRRDDGHDPLWRSDPPARARIVCSSPLALLYSHLLPGTALNSLLRILRVLW